MSFLDKGLKEAFDKKNPQRFPRFKKKGQGIDSFRYPQGFQLAWNAVSRNTPIRLAPSISKGQAMAPSPVE